MRKSIRWRLQAWYALVLVTVVAGFAGILYYQVRAARLQEIDAWLESAVHYLDLNLRPFPPFELKGEAPPDPLFPEPPPPRRPPPPPDKDWFGPRPWPKLGPPEKDGLEPPPPPNLEHLMSVLTLPRRGGAAGDEAARGTYFVVWRTDGSVFKASALPEGISQPGLLGTPLEMQPRLLQRGDNREIAMRGPEGTLILVGKPIRAELAALGVFAWQLVGAGAAFLVVGLAGGWLVSARILRPLAAISETASAISATNLSERIDTDQVDRELTDLAGVLNATFDRLAAAFERQTRFTADASHELRTPLAIIRSHAELALSRPRSIEEYREAVATCLRASTRMTTLVDGLLILARADAGQLDLQDEVIDLQRVVEDCIGLFRPLAETKNVALSASLASVQVQGDAGRLGQVITNLLSNAAHYNRPDGKVHVRLWVEAGEAVLAVADTGCGIPEKDRPHIFERFYRVDKARSRASGSNGLGLAICKSIVEAHGGSIGFESELDRGTTFWVRLPCTGGVGKRRTGLAGKRTGLAGKRTGLAGQQTALVRKQTGLAG